MRTIVFSIFLFLIAQPAFAQRTLKQEPMVLDPYSVVLVDNGSCSAGKVLKVTGSIKGLRRKKSCVPLDDVTGSATARM